mmetsp:Transcript_14975/g.34594  ORF Transcript_14975/g.34594 Transcript_14975/m.34594 type:complete len:360 (-) Transcript_14975:831-1910(-)
MVVVPLVVALALINGLAVRHGVDLEVLVDQLWRYPQILLDTLAHVLVHHLDRGVVGPREDDHRDLGRGRVVLRLHDELDLVGDEKRRLREVRALAHLGAEKRRLNSGLLPVPARRRVHLLDAPRDDEAHFARVQPRSVDDVAKAVSRRLELWQDDADNPAELGLELAEPRQPRQGASVQVVDRWVTNVRRQQLEDRVLLEDGLEAKSVVEVAAQRLAPVPAHVDVAHVVVQILDLRLPMALSRVEVEHEIDERADHVGEDRRAHDLREDRDCDLAFGPERGSDVAVAHGGHGGEGPVDRGKVLRAFDARPDAVNRPSLDPILDAVVGPRLVVRERLHADVVPEARVHVRDEAHQQAQLR